MKISTPAALLATCTTKLGSMGMSDTRCATTTTRPSAPLYVVTYFYILRNAGIDSNLSNQALLPMVNTDMFSVTCFIRLVFQWLVLNFLGSWATDNFIFLTMKAARTLNSGIYPQRRHFNTKRSLTRSVRVLCAHRRCSNAVINSAACTSRTFHVCLSLLMVPGFCSVSSFC